MIIHYEAIGNHETALRIQKQLWYNVAWVHTQVEVPRRTAWWSKLEVEELQASVKPGPGQVVASHVKPYVTLN